LHCCEINKFKKKQGARKKQGAIVVGGKVVIAPCHQM